MRIGFDATVLDPATRYTGMGEYTAKLLRALSRADQTNQYVVYGPPGSRRLEGLGENLHWRALPRVPIGKLSAPARHHLLLPLLALQDRLDLLHVPTVNTFASHPPVPALLPCRLVVTLHDLIPLTYYHLRQPSGAPWAWSMRVAYSANLLAARRASSIITVSQAAQSEILRQFNCRSDRVVAIYLGTDFCRSPNGDNGDLAVLERLGLRRPYVLFGGSWEPRKNLCRAVEAFHAALAAGLDCDLVLIVDRPPPSDIARAPRQRFLFGLPEPDLRAVYRNAHLFVFPSLSEGFGLPPLQAMACGVPVVASAIPALQEVLADAAYFVDPLDVRSIASGLLAAATDEPLRARLVAAGRRQAERYTWEETARRTLTVYRTTVRESGAAARKN
jgi:glycosyltransferase involved in cell wall biosynthesis